MNVFGKKIEAGGDAFAFTEEVKLKGVDFLVLGKFGAHGEKKLFQLRLSWHAEDKSIQAGTDGTNFGAFSQVEVKGKKLTQADVDRAQKLLVDRVDALAKSIT